MSKLVDYIFANYSQKDAERLSKVKMIASLFVKEDEYSEQKVRDIVDKVALLNGIEKVEKEHLDEPTNM